MKIQYKQYLRQGYIWLKAQRGRVLLMALILGSVMTVAAVGMLLLAHRSQEKLAQSVVRFHVLANSDSEEDQALKLKVRDQVISYLETELKSAGSREETEAMLQRELTAIRRVAIRTLREAGSSQTVRVSLQDSDFPTKRYGSVCLPAGTYRALRIELGEAEGANWWCMLFPSLCFAQAQEDSLPPETEEELSEQLPEDENELIHQDEAGPWLRFRFKLIEWWAAIFG